MSLERVLELELILACMGERKHRAELTEIWNEHH